MDIGKLQEQGIEAYWLTERSPLNNLPLDTEREQRACLDGIRYCFNIAMLSYSRLQRDLSHLPDIRLSKEDCSVEFASVFSDAWTIIDAIHRMRGFARAVAGHKNSRDVKRLIQDTSGITDLRNAIQHTHSTLGKIAKSGSAAWGTLKWITIEEYKPFRANTFVISSGSFAHYKQQFMEIDGREIVPGVVVHLVQLEAFKQAVELRGIMRIVAMYMQKLEQHLAPQYQGLPTGARDMFVSAAVSSEEGIEWPAEAPLNSAKG